MISQPGSIVRRVAAIAALLAVLGGCATDSDIRDTPVPTRSGVVRPPASLGIGERAAAVALRQVGVPYRYGGSSPGGFDCSGLVYYAYANVGKQLPRTTAGLWSGLQPVAADGIRTGDLLFFRIEGKMAHVGLYVGNGRFVHAPSSGRSVSVERLGSEFYSKAFIRGGRPE
jgi:cell wall-associated NlpC family hydrolase